jgi:WD40 repeat protein
LFFKEINPSPAAILTGHESEITCLWISAELGIVLSGSERSFVLQHTLTGDILRALEHPSDISTPRLLSLSNDGDIIVCYDRSKVCLYTLNGNLIKQAIFEDETIQVKNSFLCNKTN